MSIENPVYVRLLNRDADNMTPDEIRTSWIEERIRNRELSVELRKRDSNIDQKMFELVCALRKENSELNRDLYLTKMINKSLTKKIYSHD